MTWNFKPSIYKSGSLVELPRPCNGLTLGQAWDYQTAKVPLQGGEQAYGHSRNGFRFAVVGQFGRNDSGNTIGEQEMWSSFASLLGLVNVADQSDKYEFFIFHHADSATYRKFKVCYTENLELNMGDDVNKLWTYTLRIVAEDPNIYTTGPGA